MALLRKKTALFVLCCCSILVSCEGSTGGASCPDRWRQFEDSCYQLTPAPLRQDRLADTCQQLGGEAVSVHSVQENSFIGNLAGGKYVWLGMRVTGRNQHRWDDGTSYSYSKFLPAGHRMLKSAIIGSGVLQQSCLRWNYDRVTRQLHGVCKRAVCQCPPGATEYAGHCYFVTGQSVPWWEAAPTCRQSDPYAQPVTLSLKDWRLTHHLTNHFGAESRLFAGVEVGSSCEWASLQYGQRAANRCAFGCPELLKVVCTRPLCPVRGHQPPEPITMMPPMYSGGEEGAAAAPSEPSCPAGWMTRGRRCVSGPTPAVTRRQAQRMCHQRHNSRLATLRQDSSRVVLALQLEGVKAAWVRDERPVASLRSSFGDRQRDTRAQPPEVDAILTADARVLTRPSSEQLPAICEHCQEPCGPGATPFLGDCYRVLEGPRTLTNASRSCAKLGGTMVSVESLAENRFLTALAFRGIHCDQPGNELWLGLQRVNAAYSWEWEDCSETSAEVWAPGAGDSGRCTTLAQDGLWRDPADCQQQLRAVCEWDPCQEQGTGQYGGTCLPIGDPTIY